MTGRAGLGGALAAGRSGAAGVARRSSWSCSSTASSSIGCPRRREASQEQLEEIARGSGKLARALNGKEIVKTVVDPGKLVNFVAR